MYGFFQWQQDVRMLLRERAWEQARCFEIPVLQSKLMNLRRWQACRFRDADTEFEQSFAFRHVLALGSSLERGSSETPSPKVGSRNCTVRVFSGWPSLMIHLWLMWWDATRSLGTLLCCHSSLVFSAQLCRSARTRIFKVSTT